MAEAHLQARGSYVYVRGRFLMRSQLDGGRLGGLNMGLPHAYGVTFSSSGSGRTPRALALLMLAAVPVLSHCGGEAQQTETDEQLCRRAATHVQSCGSANYLVDCTYLTPDNACENRCDLDASCDYFQGNSPSENRTVAQCGSRCTCQSAQRRAASCGVAVSFTCDHICNCPYSYDCELGIPAYAACRAQCPPWPEPG
jgi:hypothetical protein